MEKFNETLDIKGKNHSGGGSFYNFLNKDIKELNKIVLSLFCILILFGAGLLSYKITSSYTLFSDSVTGENTIKLVADTTKVFDYTGNDQEYSVPQTGYYYVELNGASGTNAGAGYGAKTTGYIKLTKGEKLYFYVGESKTGDSASNTTSFNGGTGSNGGAPGGGATDVRFVSGNWDDTESLISRIMVAAGGGSGDSGTYAGDAISLNGFSNDLKYSTYNYATEGTQISGGTSAYSAYANGSFGKGGGGCGGGGGYYGGGGNLGVAGSASGSSYISGYAGVNSIKESTTITHTNGTLHYSGKYFLGFTITPAKNFGNGNAKITYKGDSLKDYNNLDNVRYIKDCLSYSSSNEQNHWVELQAIKEGVNVAKDKIVTGTISESPTHPYSKITDGDINYSNYAQPSSNAKNQCITVDLENNYNLDEIAVWHYYDDNRKYYDNITYVSSDNSNWNAVIEKEEAETSNGKRVNRYSKQPDEGININDAYEFIASGAPKSFWVPKTGKYKIELWGASINTEVFDKYLNSSTVSPDDKHLFEKIGAAGYVQGEIELVKNELLYLYVGTGGYVEHNKRTANNGGFNGGGKGGIAGTNTTYKYSAGVGGGGATDIRFILAPTYDMTSSSLNSRIMVAGGAGGSETNLKSYPDALYSGNAGGLSSIIGKSYFHYV